jgi:hypothetical protein
MSATWMPGDPAKIAGAILEAARAQPAPARLVLGSDVYALVRAAMSERLAAVEAQREVELSTDADDLRAA